MLNLAIKKISSNCWFQKYWKSLKTYWMVKLH